MKSRERSMVEPTSPQEARPKKLRGFVSPCSICDNNIPVFISSEEALNNYIESNGIRPCPKNILYKKKLAFKDQPGFDDINWLSPLYDEKLHYVNPVWPNASNRNQYAYAFVATIEDNVETGLNPGFELDKMICRGPFLIEGIERNWHLNGHLEEGDPVLISSLDFNIDKFLFKGFVKEASIWQVAAGYLKNIDLNVTKSFSAAGVV